MYTQFIKYSILFILLFGFTLWINAFDRKDPPVLGSKRAPVEINFLIEQLGKYKKLKNQDEVHSNQEFMIRVKTGGSKAYFYALSLDATNRLQIFFPREEVSYKNPLEANTIYSFPPDENEEGLMYQFDENVGLERFYIYSSTKPISKLEKLIRKIPSEGVVISKKSSLKKKLENTKSLSQDHYARKLILIHKSNEFSLVDKKLIQKAKKEEWDD